MPRRVAVTGATGFIGRNLTAHLAARGFDVRAIVRHESDALPPRTPDQPAREPEAGSGRRPGTPRGLHPDVTVVPSPLEPAALTAAFQGVDAIVHLAGVVSTLREKEYTRVNVAGTRAVAEAARAVHARLVHVSSLAAAGPASLSRPRSEDDQPAPITPYGRSKLASEHAVAGVAGLDWIVLRPGIVYGPGDRALLPLFRFARAGVIPLVGRTGAAYTIVHVADVARTIEAAIDADIEKDTIFVGSPRPVTARELIERVRTAAGSAMIVRIPRPLALLAAAACDVAGAIRGRPLPLNSRRYRELYAEGFACRVDRLRDRLGIVAQIGLDEGLAQTAAWYREQGWL